MSVCDVSIGCVNHRCKQVHGVHTQGLMLLIGLFILDRNLYVDDSTVVL